MLQARLRLEDHEWFSEGKTFFKKGDYDRAAFLLLKARERQPDHPLAGSYLGLALVKLGSVEEGIELCHEAYRDNKLHAELVFNLAQAHRWAGNRQEAREFFLLGAKLTHRNRRFINALIEMGVRRKPVISFLSRDHFLNKWLGKWTYRPGQFRIEDIEN